MTNSFIVRVCAEQSAGNIHVFFYDTNYGIMFWYFDKPNVGLFI